MTGQNTSSAVMQQRSEAHDSLDDFPTPPWATRALCEWIALHSPKRLGDMSCREPAANRGYMVKPLQEYFGRVDPSDIHDYGAGFPVADYLFPYSLESVDWTISNPPFRLAEQFIDKAMETSTEGLAMLVRSAFVEGEGRYKRMFSRRPPSYILQFTERVVIMKGRILQAGTPLPWDPTRKASTATAYAWLVWFQHRQGATIFDWIPPCRKALERAEDYE